VASGNRPVVIRDVLTISQAGCSYESREMDIQNFTLCASLFTLSSLIAASAISAESTLVLSPEAKIEGKSQAEWSLLWWQWAGSFEYDESPIADPTGANCQNKQNGNVWFLAGTYGSHRTIRKCTVPRGRYLFFPLINYVVMPCAGGSDCTAAATCQEVKSTARATTDNPSTLILEIDGARIAGLERQRQASPECFDMAAKANTAFKVYPSAADGYYVMLAPLKPGTHVINFGGVLPSMVQAVTYTVIVK
jgi:hypothetical protein